MLILTNKMATTKPNARRQGSGPASSPTTALRRKYNEQHEQITRNLDRIREMMRDHKMASEHNPENWGYVGELGEIAADLRAIVGRFPLYFRESIENEIGEPTI